MVLFALLFVQLLVGVVDAEILLVGIVAVSVGVGAFGRLCMIAARDKSAEEGRGEARTREIMFGRRKKVNGILTKVIMGLVLLAVSRC